MNTMPSGTPAADITVDGTGLLCVSLLLRLRKRIDGAVRATVAHVVATDPAAPLDLPAWCHMTGHHHLGPVPDAADRLCTHCGSLPMLALPEQAPPGMRMTRKADSPPHLGSLAVRSGWAVTRSAWRSSP
ncbi:sulfurtransferase TusA family protein [Streptomyces diastaticus]|uniref:sulfurtransferase TusA family protein n=1 Tax=Streptomyces diastaticus TaxID=1956 RepID=UPI0035D78365